MAHFYQHTRQLCRTLLVGLLVGFIWLQSSASVAAANLQERVPYYTQPPSREQVSNPVKSASNESTKRIEAIASCLPDELSRSNQNIADRISRAVGEMGNDQLERALRLSDSPELSNAEVEFQNCLQRKGITPVTKRG